MTSPHLDDRRPSASPPRLITAAGGVVWRREAGQDQVAVIHRPRYDDYTLPKGKLEAGETFEDAAVREVQEETGIAARITGFITVVAYSVGKAPKIVVFFQMEVDFILTFTAGEEVDRLEWLPASDAEKRLTHRGEQEVLREAARLRGPALSS